MKTAFIQIFGKNYPIILYLTIGLFLLGIILQSLEGYEYKILVLVIQDGILKLKKKEKYKGPRVIYKGPSIKQRRLPETWIEQE